MTSPTREEIQTAYDALETLTNTCTHSIDLAEELQELVLRALPPKPRPTMEHVEWDNKRHFLAVVDVDHELYKKAIMLKQNVYDNTIQCFALHPHKCVVCHFGPAFLTPTGERYTYTEAQDG